MWGEVCSGSRFRTLKHCIVYMHDFFKLSSHTHTNTDHYRHHTTHQHLQSPLSLQHHHTATTPHITTHVYKHTTTPKISTTSHIIIKFPTTAHITTTRHHHHTSPSNPPSHHTFLVSPSPLFTSPLMQVSTCTINTTIGGVDWGSG